MNAPAPRVPKPTPAQLAKAGKERKQLFVLGFLALAFVLVLVIQFGGSDGVGVSTPDDEPTAAADAAAGSANVPAFRGSTAEDNDAFLAAGEEPQTVGRNPFIKFWNRGEEDDDEADVEIPELPVPTINIGGTFTGANPMAHINGSLRRVGDVVDGWTLVDVSSRAVMLRSPTKRTVTIEMPKIAGVN